MPNDKTIHDNSDPHAVSNNSYRATAERLLKDNTVNGQLNLDGLRQDTKAEAQRIVFSQHGIDLATHNGGVKPEVDAQIADLTLATREVLGIVPQRDWKHNARDLTSNTVESLAAMARGETTPTNGLHCTQAGHEIGYIDPGKSLSAQGVNCALPPKPGKQR